MFEQRAGMLRQHPDGGRCRALAAEYAARVLLTVLARTDLTGPTTLQRGSCTPAAATCCSHWRSDWTWTRRSSLQRGHAARVRQPVERLSSFFVLRRPRWRMTSARRSLAGCRPSAPASSCYGRTVAGAVMLLPARAGRTAGRPQRQRIRLPRARVARPAVPAPVHGHAHAARAQLATSRAQARDDASCAPTRCWATGSLLLGVARDLAPGIGRRSND